MSTRVPKVSVCVPSYNHSRYLSATLDSILAQTFQDFEIVIVDDGSTDGSLAIAEKYAAEHPSIVRLFTHPEHKNLGISTTVNLAFNNIRGQYWMGLPSDDLLYPEKLERQVHFLDHNPEYGWVYSYADFIDEEGRPLRHRGLFGIDITKDNDPFDTLIRRNKIPGMTALMRSEVSSNVGLHESGLIYSDWHYWIRMTAAAKVGFINEPLIHYRIHETNTSLGVDAETNTQRCIEVTETIRKDIEAGLIARSTSRIKALLDLQLSYFAYCLDQRRESSANLRRAFAIDPSLLTDGDYLRDWLTDLCVSFGNHLFVSQAAPSSFTEWFLENLPRESTPDLRRRIESEYLAQLAMDPLETNWLTAQRLAVKSLLKDPQRLSNRRLRRLWLYSMAGDTGRKAWRRLKGQ
jgi:glycosyltransferase involved in cell wall biosynthesis